MNREARVGLWRRAVETGRAGDLSDKIVPRYHDSCGVPDRLVMALIGSGSANSRRVYSKTFDLAKGEP